MKTSVSTIDTSILPEDARKELYDFYSFLVAKYTRSTARHAKRRTASPGTAGALADSGLAGIWKDRSMDDSPAFARALREKAQTRRLS
jgi:hypothetical protein